MKQFCLIILLGLFTTIHLCGQETKKHVVQRGETLESIAQDYNLSSAELQSANYNIEVFYTGLEINVPVKTPTAASTEASQSSDSDEQYMKTLAAYYDDCEIADKLFEARKYSKAQKQYQLTIQKYKGTLACEDALYGNALCSYNREKWKSAIKDLSAVVNNKECPQQQRDHCRKLLEKAVSYREQQLENRSRLWGGLVMTAVTVGASVAAASSQSKQSSKNYSSSSSSSTSSSGSTSSSVDTSYSSEGASSSVSSSSKSSCPSLKVCNGKYYCANTGNCGMCGGDGLMDGQFGQGTNCHKCTLCGGSGKCKYCQ